MKKREYAIWTYILILALFTIFFVMNKNYEFLFYTFTLGAFIYLIYLSDKKFKYSSFAKWGLSIWLFLHFSGGSFYFGKTKLYDLVLIPIIGEPYNLLRYDQVIHFFCYVVITLFVYSIMNYIADKKTNKYIFATIVIFAGVGIGALNEIIEFLTVVFFSATGVGNYTNNALDLIFNLLGAITAVLVSSRKR